MTNFSVVMNQCGFGLMQSGMFRCDVINVPTSADWSEVWFGFLPPPDSKQNSHFFSLWKLAASVESCIDLKRFLK